MIEFTLPGAFPYPSRRMPVFADNVLAASQPLAAQAGLRMIQKGGNAVDAALATAVTLTVVEPTGTGIGGDAFALVWDGQRLHGINGSGRSPHTWTPERFAGRQKMPDLGWDTVTVPGCVSVWAALSKRFGRLPFAELFSPAVEYARNGFIVSPSVADHWAQVPTLYSEFPEFAAAFLPEGRAPKAGERFPLPDQADSLQEIAETGGASFYHGKIAEKIDAHSRKSGGGLRAEDLAAHQPEWVEPISTAYRTVQVHELPPNGQGLAALIALGLLRHWQVSETAVDSADSVHLQVEAMKIAFSEAHRHIADPAFMEIGPASLLEESFLAARAKEIRMDRAGHPKSSANPEKGTVYFTAADSSGMMVSFIQSNYRGFGSGIVVPGTGISLHNRGCGFTLAPGHPNQVGPAKRPYHTIIPAFVTAGGKPKMSFGVMGAHMQPQGHVQMITRIFDYGLNPQAASDAPRWFVGEDFRLALEPGLAHLRPELAKRGHRFIENPPTYMFGGAQLIYRLEGNNGYCAASDPRKDGCAIGF
ncbi:MAG: gamma-glutamyltransferase family protein [Desulfobacterales bacterium]|nr:gamma-glutamyltransferase family protein [Desulfobacterales bacterium]